MNHISSKSMFYIDSQNRTSGTSGNFSINLAKCFVIDVGLTPNGWKIIECGSISCAGFYDANMQTLIMALEDAYNSEQYNPSVDGLYISKCWKESINKHKHKK